MHVNVTAAALRALLIPVLPFAATAAELPVLNAIRLRGNGDVLTATATDRFRLGVTRIPVEPTGWFETLLSVADAKRLLAWFKPQRGIEGMLRLTVTDNTLRVEATDVLAFGVSAASVEFLRVPGTYPSVESLVAKALQAPQGTEGLAFNPVLLAPFAKVPGTLRVKPGAGMSQPTVFEGENFIGLLMHRRTADEAPLGASWGSLFGITDDVPETVPGQAVETA